MTRRLLTALLYASLALTANPVSAAGYPPGLRAELEGMRTDTLRKLAIHEAPKPVPEITFEELDGTEHSLAESDGKVRLLNFWATWCGPCREEKPALDALNASMGGADFEVIAVATGRNSPEGIERFNREHGIDSLHTYIDPNSAAARSMGVLGLPVTLVLDREGREVGRLTGGADWDSESARAILKALMDAGV